ncbi:MAG: hypothetical protein IKN98_02315 [Bacteroidales bacterium]|nr:hypothetical protein [Bacteroidales bacterium]
MSTINFNQCNFHIGNFISAPFKPFGHSIEDQPALFHQLSPEIQELYRQMPNREFGNISIVGDGILQFSSHEHYENVMEILEEDCDKWDGLFSDKYAYMDFEQMDEFCDRINYNQFLPILLFEDKIGISGKTLFDAQAIAMQKWMDNDLTGTSPRDSIFILESEQAVHSINREVCIGNTIYQFREEATIEIPLSEVNAWTLHRFDTLTELEKLPFNIVIRSIPVASSALRILPFRKIEGEFTHSTNSIIASDEKIVWSYIGKLPTPWNATYRPKVISKITCYKKNRRGKFKKHRRMCSTAPIVTFYVKVTFGENPPTQRSIGPCEKMKEEKKRSERTGKQKCTPINCLENHNYTIAVFKDHQEDTEGRTAYERIAVSIDGETFNHII